MSKSPEMRLYNIADADMLQKADLLKMNVQRDSAPFATRNVDGHTMDAYTDLLNAFRQSTTDEEFRGEITAQVLAKDAVAENIRKSIRHIRNMAELQYGGKGRYNNFGFEDMANLSDNDLYRSAKRVLRMATKLLPELATQGLTQTQLLALEKLVNDLDIAIDTAAEAQEIRDIETQTRIMLGNTLWAEATRLASIGQTLFADVDEAKYNDYVLNDTPPAPPPPITP